MRCEVCSQAFCKQSALKTHQDQGCEALISCPESPEAVDSKPTLIDAEPGMSIKRDEEEIENLIECNIIPKQIDTGDDEALDDIESNYAEISAENESMRSEPCHSNARNGTRTKKSRRKTLQKRNTSHGNENDAAERIFHCYLCEKR